MYGPITPWYQAPHHTVTFVDALLFHPRREGFEIPRCESFPSSHIHLDEIERNWHRCDNVNGYQNYFLMIESCMLDFHQLKKVLNDYNPLFGCITHQSNKCQQSTMPDTRYQLFIFNTESVLATSVYWIALRKRSCVSRPLYKFFSRC